MLRRSLLRVLLPGLVGRVPAAAVAIGCGAGYVPSGYLRGDADREAPLRRVAGSAVYQSSSRWQQAPWFRITDRPDALPIFVLYDVDGMGCLVPAEIFALNPPDIACPSGWRWPKR
jgi:hypothetical protein